jgi:hypothetical protein
MPAARAPASRVSHRVGDILLIISCTFNPPILVLQYITFETDAVYTNFTLREQFSNGFHISCFERKII